MIVGFKEGKEKKEKEKIGLEDDYFSEYKAAWKYFESFFSIFLSFAMPFIIGEPLSIKKLRYSYQCSGYQVATIITTAIITDCNSRLPK